MSPYLSRSILRALALGALLSACSHAPPPASAPAEPTATPPGGPESSRVEITYLLGHEHYRFVAEAQAGQASAQSFLERKLLDQGQVGATEYRNFFARTKAYVDAMPAAPAAPGQAPCRTPFVIDLSSNAGQQTAHGCRQTDQKAFSRLVKDGEFLLYSRKR